MAGNYREEEDPFEEDIVFDQAGLFNRSLKLTSAIRRVSSGKCGLFSKTIGLCGAFFGLGLCIAIPGPTFLAPEMTLQTEVSPISNIYAARSSGYLIGAIIGGFLFDHFNRLFLLFISLLLTSIFIMIVPWCDVFWLLQSCMVVLGVLMGFLDTGGNVLCLDLWGRNSGPFMQALHFSFGLGAFIAPLLAAPFLESSFLANLTSNSLSTYPEMQMNSNVLHSFGFNATRRYKRDLQPYINTTDLSLPLEIVSTSNNVSYIFENVSVTSISIPSTVLVDISNNTVSQDDAYLMTTTNSASTQRIPKPKPSKTDGSKLGPENWDKVHVGIPPVADLLPPSTTIPTTSQVITTSLPIGLLYNSTVTESWTADVQQFYGLGDNEDKSSRVETSSSSIMLPDSHSEYLIESTSEIVNVSTVHISTTFEEMSTLTETNVDYKPTPMQPNTPTVSIPLQPNMPTVSPVKASSFEEEGFMLTLGPRYESSTKKPMIFDESIMTRGSNEERDYYMNDLNQDDATTRTTVEESTSVEYEKITTYLIKQTPLIIDSTKHVHHFKPGTYDNDTEDIDTIFNIFANKVEKYGLSKFQFAYLIVGFFVFLISLVFLGFLCHNPRDPKSKQEEGQGAKTVISQTMSNILVLLMALFLLLYIGLEVTYGQLIIAYAVRSDVGLPKTMGILLSAVFWGTFATMRFASIFISSGLSPMSMLLLNIVTCTSGTIVLSAAGNGTETALWIGTILIGIGLASIFPTSILWIERYIHVSNKVAAVFVVGVTLGEMIVPIIVYQLMIQHPTILLHSTLVINFLCIIIFVALWWLASRLGEKYCVVNNNGYQLANQNEEEEDMIEMSPSTSRLSLQRQSLSSEHRSLLNGNLTRKP